MGEPYLKEWLNISLCLSKEIKDISEDFRNGYLFGEILHKHKLIPNFEFYKDSMNKSDISKNYQYLSKAFGDLNIKFSDTRRNDILNKKHGVSWWLHILIFNDCKIHSVFICYLLKILYAGITDIHAGYALPLTDQFLYRLLSLDSILCHPGNILLSLMMSVPGV